MGLDSIGMKLEKRFYYLNQSQFVIYSLLASVSILQLFEEANLCQVNLTWLLQFKVQILLMALYFRVI